MNDKAEILIVDDNEKNRAILKDFSIALGHSPVLAENGLSALSLIRKKTPDLVLLDIMMPQMDGYQTLERIKAEHKSLPVIMISALDEIDSVVRCIEMGADDYLVKPFDFTLLKARIFSCLEKKFFHDREVQYQNQIEDYNQTLEERVKSQIKEISASQYATIFALAKLAQSRDPETGEHLLRMREYAKALSVQLAKTEKYKQRIDDAFIENIYVAAPLHDIGKVGIPDRILQKPGRLTEDEFAIMKTHAAIGAETLKEVKLQYPNNGFIKAGIEVAECHHEKWDGSGYPKGLRGEEIPLTARIVTLGDVYDALTSERVYKEAFSHEKAKAMIMEGNGKHFDPEVVDAFVSIEDEFVAISEKYKDCS